MNDKMTIVPIPLDMLEPHPDNPRKDLGDLTELADSINTNGIMQNLTVVASPDSNKYRVVIGHRRMAAAKLAGLTELPCVVSDMDHKEQVATMLAENMQRSDLTVYEQAWGFQQMTILGCSVEEISSKSGFSQSTVRRRLKMAELDQNTLRSVSTRQISLMDFDKLSEIEDLRERNKVLANIGTRDFDASVSRALTVQQERKNRPLQTHGTGSMKTTRVAAITSMSQSGERTVIPRRKRLRTMFSTAWRAAACAFSVKRKRQSLKRSRLSRLQEKKQSARPGRNWSR